MYTVNLKRIFIVSLFIAIPFMLSAQLTYGTTGLLHAPSAEMQKDKTVMLGANFMNKEITPPTWYYYTYNYYLNVTILPVSYTHLTFVSVFFHPNTCLLKNGPENPLVILNNIHLLF